METTNLSLMISCKYALWGQIALPSLVENAQSYSSSHCNIWISASSASPFPKSFFRKKSLSKNVVLQKCWLASFKPGQPDWKTSFRVVFFPWPFSSARSAQFSRPVVLVEMVLLMFSFIQNVSYFPRTLQYKYFSPRYVAVCAESWGRYIWVSLGAQGHSPKEHTCSVTAQPGWLFSMLGSLRWGVWSFFVATSLWHFTPDVGFLGLNTWNLGCSRRCCIPLAWDFQSVPHLIFMTQTSMKPKNLRLDVAYCFLIYILRREHAIPF